MLGADALRPFVVSTIADHELHLIVRAQIGEVAPQVAIDLAGPGRLHVEDSYHAGVDARRVERSARLERGLVAGVAEPREQSDAGRLRERLAAGHGHIARIE